MNGPLGTIIFWGLAIGSVLAIAAAHNYLTKKGDPAAGETLIAAGFVGLWGISLLSAAAVAIWWLAVHA